MNDLNKIFNELKALKLSLLAIERNSMVLGGWLPKKYVMRYFDYADNQLRLLEGEGALVVSKVGRRKFYSLESIISLIEKNKK